MVLISTLSFVPGNASLGALRALRAVRALRPLRLIVRFPGLRLVSVLVGWAKSMLIDLFGSYFRRLSTPCFPQSHVHKTSSSWCSCLCTHSPCKCDFLVGFILTYSHCKLALGAAWVFSSSAEPCHGVPTLPSPRKLTVSGSFSSKGTSVPTFHLLLKSWPASRTLQVSLFHASGRRSLAQTIHQTTLEKVLLTPLTAF